MERTLTLGAPSWMARRVMPWIALQELPKHLACILPFRLGAAVSACVGVLTIPLTLAAAFVIAALAAW